MCNGSSSLSDTDPYYAQCHGKRHNCDDRVSVLTSNLKVFLGLLSVLYVVFFCHVCLLFFNAELIL